MTRILRSTPMTRYPTRSSYYFERGLALSTYTGWITGTLTAVALLPGILFVFGLIGMTAGGGGNYDTWESLFNVALLVPAILKIAMAIIFTVIAWLRFEARTYDLVALVFVPIWVLLLWSFAGPYFLIESLSMLFSLASWNGIKTLLTELMPFALLVYLGFYRRSDFGDRWQDIVAKSIALFSATVLTVALIGQMIYIDFGLMFVAKIASPTDLISPVVLLDHLVPATGSILMMAFFGSLAYLTSRAVWGD